jgi:hypothetical protein
LRGYRWNPRDESDISASELARIQIYRSVAVGLAHVDTMRAADYQSRGLVRALRAGEPNRVSRALALEAAFLASEGIRRSKQAFALLETARTIARNLSDRTLTALQLGLEAVMSVCTGQFARAPALAIECEQMAGGRMTQWELNPVRMFHLRSLRFMGLFSTLETYATEYARDASRRGDESMRTGLPYALNSVWLARGDTRRASLEPALRPWGGTEHDFHVQHLQRIVAEGELALCERAVQARHVHFRRRLQQFMRSTLRRVQIVRCEAFWIRGRMAIAAAEQSAAADELLVEAAAAAKALAREGVGYASAWESLLRAAIHLRRGASDQALAALREASRHADASSLNMVAAVARRREGELLGGSDGEQLVVQSDERMRALGARAPDAVMEVYAPGFRK